MANLDSTIIYGYLQVNDILLIERDATIEGQLTVNQASGTSPLVIASTTKVDNLNADLLDGNHASAFSLTTHDHDSDYSDISHNHTLDSLSNIEITSKASGEILKWDGMSWVNNTLSEAGIAASGHDHGAEYADISHNHSLDSLSNTTITSIASGEILKWNGSAWINNTLTEAGIAASDHAHALNDLSNVNTSPSDGNALIWNNSAGEWQAGTAGTTIDYLSDISDVTITDIASGEILKWDGMSWVNNTLSEAGIAASGHDHDSDYSDINHNHTLDSLSNTTITSIASGELLKWNGSAWINNTLTEAGIAASGHNHDSAYLGITATAADADKLDNQDGTYYLNWNNFSNIPSTFTPSSHNNSAHSDTYITASDISTHASVTTSIHGITDTSDLALKSGNVNQFADITSSGANIEDAVTKRHSQNTDTGTSSTTFYIGSSGPKIKNSSGIMQIRNNADSDYADLVVNNLTVQGTTTTINSETVTFNDNVLILNNNYSGDTPTENGGLEIERGSLTNASLIWDESNDVWKSGLAGSEKTLIVEGNSVTLTGDVTGTANFGSNGTVSITTSVSSYSHNHTLDGLSNTTITSIASGELLKWNGSAWINNTLTEAGIAASGHNHDSAYADISHNHDSDYSDISHNHTLDSLSNTTITSIASGELLKWNGTAWINNTLTEAGIAASGHDHSGVYAVSDHNHTLDSLSNTTITSIASGELLKWNGTAWINNTLTEAGIAASGHNHDSAYADISHNHDSDYASTTHNHDSDYADISHSHALNDLSNVSAASPSDGDAIIWNSTNSAWENSSISPTINTTGKSFSASASQTEFDISDIYPSGTGAISVFVNGLYQLNIQDYTVDTTSGSEKITFTSGCASGDRVVVNINTTNASLYSTHSHDDNYLALSGGTLTGELIISGTTKAAGKLYAGTSDPTNTTRLNYDGYLYATKLYNAVYNDVAECFESNGLIYENVKNKIIEIDIDGKIKIAEEESDGVIGIVSDSYGFLLGGSEEEIQNNIKIPIGLIGTLWIDSETKPQKSDIRRFVCAGKNGTARVIPKNETYKYCGCIVGKIIDIDENKNKYKVIINLK